MGYIVIYRGCEFIYTSYFTTSAVYKRVYCSELTLHVLVQSVLSAPRPAYALFDKFVVAPRAKRDFCEQQANFARFKAGAQCLKLKLQYKRYNGTQSA